MTTTSENRKLLKSIEDAVNNRDGNAIADIYADDFVFHREMDELHGLDEFNDYLETLYNAFPDMTISIGRIIVEDDMAAVQYTGTGTHEGQYNGIEPAGQEVELSGMRIVRIADGEIVEAWGQTSNLSLLGQLGVVELPAQ